MATTSTNAILDQIRTRLLTFQPPAAAATLTTRLGGRLWIDWAPDTAAFPYGIMRVVDNTRATDYDANRDVIQLEVMIHGNKRTQSDDVEDAADVCDMAMNDYSDSTSGMVFCRNRSRSTAPATEDPAYRENAIVRLVYELVVYPLYLNT